MDSNSLIKQLLLLGLGTTSVMLEKLRDVPEEWLRDGKMNSEQATDFVNEMADRLKTEQGNLETFLQRQIRNVLQDLGVPRQNEIDELRGRIDRLERQMRDLENKKW